MAQRLRVAQEEACNKACHRRTGRRSYHVLGVILLSKLAENTARRQGTGGSGVAMAVFIAGALQELSMVLCRDTGLMNRDAMGVSTKASRMGARRGLVVRLAEPWIFRRLLVWFVGFRVVIWAEPNKL